MRPDIVPGAIFPYYEFSDHTRKRRKLSDCEDNIKWISSSAADVSVPGTTGKLNCLLNSIVSSRLAIVGWNRLAPRIVTHPKTNEQSVPPLFHPRCAVR
jgi:hypothetical protein